MVNAVCWAKFERASLDNYKLAIISWMFRKGKITRPAKPVRNPEYPKKIQLALLLLENFREYHPEISIKCVLADALYGSEEFMSGASNLLGGVQVISQLSIVDPKNATIC